MKILNKKISSKKSSAEWMRRQLSDPYVERAKKEGFRARAAYKLAELDDRFHMLENARVVVDLGAAPGSWAQYAKRTRPNARVIAMDLLPIKPIEGVEFYQGDFTGDAALAWLDSRLAAGGGAQPRKRLCDAVLSDMAPNTTGHQRTDHLRQTTLLEYAFDFAKNNLRHGGSFVAKSFTGGTTPSLLAEIKKVFQEVHHVKPAASRKDSVEMFIVALGFREANSLK
ncbi:MAG: RlmE family RNA methyltransferase [Rickettsiales bacterium]|jgi:23S rRNA (uridine2552-2'-O)-methyltransferase|nr:RlmE family RNA methyltransferase [Rickettsiales bacterium]